MSRLFRRAAGLLIPLLGFCTLVFAEAGILVVHVEDYRRHPISGVSIGVKGEGGADITRKSGMARIPLAKDTKENSLVFLQILRSPPGKEYLLIHPLDEGVRVPPFENASGNFVPIVVVEKGEEDILASGAVVTALLERILRETQTLPANKGSGRTETWTTVYNSKTKASTDPSSVDEASALAILGKRFGIAPEKIDKAIRALSAEDPDSYEGGLAALYARNYPKATASLEKSLKMREEHLASDQKKVADAAFFLGMSLFQQGRYDESSSAYQQSLKFRPDDGRTLNNLALSQMADHKYEDAEMSARKSLTLSTDSFGPADPNVGTIKSNLASILSRERKYSEAEPLAYSALDIHQRALGKENSYVGTDFNNWAEILYETHQDDAAYSAYKNAIAIHEKSLGEWDPALATDYSNFVKLLVAERKFDEAEGYARKALAIDEKSVGEKSREVVIDRCNLGAVLQGQMKFAEAAEQYGKALALGTEVLDPLDPMIRIASKGLEAVRNSKRGAPEAK